MTSLSCNINITRILFPVQLHILRFIKYKFFAHTTGNPLRQNIIKSLKRQQNIKSNFDMLNTARTSSLNSIPCKIAQTDV